MKEHSGVGLSTVASTQQHLCVRCVSPMLSGFHSSQCKNMYIQQVCIDHIYSKSIIIRVLLTLSCVSFPVTFQSVKHFSPAAKTSTCSHNISTGIQQLSPQLAKIDLIWSNLALFGCPSTCLSAGDGSRGIFYCPSPIRQNGIIHPGSPNKKRLIA